MSEDVTRLKQREVEGFQVGDGTSCSDKVVYAGGSFCLVGLGAGALHSAYPRIWPAKHYGPTLMTSLHLMSKHSITFGLAAGAFALGACLTAKLRNKEGILNCIAGGTMGGMVFALRYRHTHSMPWTTFGIGLLIACGTSAYKLVYGTYLPDFPRDERSAFVMKQRSDAKAKEMTEISKQREIDFENWRSKQ